MRAALALAIVALLMLSAAARAAAPAQDERTCGGKVTRICDDACQKETREVLQAFAGMAASSKSRNLTESLAADYACAPGVPGYCCAAAVTCCCIHCDACEGDCAQHGVEQLMLADHGMVSSLGGAVLPQLLRLNKYGAFACARAQVVCARVCVCVLCCVCARAVCLCCCCRRAQVGETGREGQRASVRRAVAAPVAAVPAQFAV